MDQARNAAVAVIDEVFNRGAYSNIALSKALRATNLRDIDRRFCTELVNGTVKCGASLDWIISNYVTRPLKKIEPKVLSILRVGVPRTSNALKVALAFDFQFVYQVPIEPQDVSVDVVITEAKIAAFYDWGMQLWIKRETPPWL